LISRDTELREAREAAELSLLQLHQVQEELEHYFLADAEKQRRLEAGVRDLEELRRSKADQESNYEQANAAQQRAHDQELEALREQFEPRLAELEQRLIIRDTELREAREIAEMSLLQLHQQVQEERERHSMAEGEIQRQLEAGVRDLEELRRIKTDQESAHEQAKAELQQGLASSESQLRQAREEAEMTFEQLHQAQEELEHYFLKARAGDQLAQAQIEQLQRAQSLMVRLNPDVLPNDPYPPALAVEVLSELPAAMPDPSLQTQALLSTYAASLQRASALLERARRS
jgi:chromosome segregation ATPase